VVRAIDPRVPFYDVSRLSDHSAAGTFRQQLAANLLVVLAVSRFCLRRSVPTAGFRSWSDSADARSAR
jgi:hypothetical protein